MNSDVLPTIEFHNHFSLRTKPIIVGIDGKPLFFKYLIVFSALQLLEPLDLGDGQALNLALQHGLVALLDRRVLRTRGHQV